MNMYISKEFPIVKKTRRRVALKKSKNVTRKFDRHLKGVINDINHTDFYCRLGVSKTASSSEIKKAFHQRSKLVHPDRLISKNAKTLFQRINEASDCLLDPIKRTRYDQCSLDGEDSFSMNEFEPNVQPDVNQSCVNHDDSIYGSMLFLSDYLDFDNYVISQEYQFNDMLDLPRGVLENQPRSGLNNYITRILDIYGFDSVLDQRVSLLEKSAVVTATIPSDDCMPVSVCGHSIRKVYAFIPLEINRSHSITVRYGKIWHGMFSLLNHPTHRSFLPVSPIRDYALIEHALAEYLNS